MPLVTTPAIVLSAMRYGETSKIVRLATREHGVQSAIAKGALRPKSSFGASLQPLSRGTAHYLSKEHRELHILTGFELAELHAQVARHRAGNLERTPWLWRRILDPLKGEVACFKVSRGGKAEGYIAWSGSWRTGRMKLDLSVKDFVALTPAAARRLWSLVADHRSVGGNVSFADAPGAPSLRVLRSRPRGS